MPRVSVLMPVYNGARYLREAVDSILHQTYSDFEFIIVDDGSTDETAAILDSYDDQRIVRVRNEENIGLTKSLNKGLALAQGEYVARMDADDVSLPERLERQVALLSRGDCKVCFTRAHLRDLRTESISAWTEYPWPLVVWRSLFEDAYGLHPSAMFDKARVLRAGGYSESFPKAQDYDLFDRLCAAGDVFGYVPEPLLVLRRHAEQISLKALPEQEECARQVSFRAMRRYLPSLSDAEAGALRWLFLRRELNSSAMPTDELLPLAARLVAAFLQPPLDKDLGQKVRLSMAQSIAHRYDSVPSAPIKRAAWKLVFGLAFRSRDWRLVYPWLCTVRHKLVRGA